MRDLGLNSMELTDLYNIRGLMWPLVRNKLRLCFFGHEPLTVKRGTPEDGAELRKDCDLTSINSEELPELQGFLSPLFSELPKLEFLGLRDTKVSGDLATLKGCERLQWLQLSGSKISGNLEALENATGLKSVWLAHIEVYGDLKALQNAVNLVHLDLRHTNVSGDLNSLENATDLDWVGLSHTKVTGGFEGLQRATSLRDLDLSHTLLSGDLKGLHAPKLVRLDLSHTKVMGELEDLPGLQASGFISYLDVSATFVRGDVSELSSWALQTLKAAGCRLEGSVKGSAFRSLVTLDLSSTGISYMESIPGKCRTLLLAQVENIGFAPGLLRRAVRDNVFVDLRNATLANHSDAWARNATVYIKNLIGFSFGTELLSLYEIGCLVSDSPGQIRLQAQGHVTMPQDAMDILNSDVVKRSGGRTNYNDQGFACGPEAYRLGV